MDAESSMDRLFGFKATKSSVVLASSLHVPEFKLPKLVAEGSR
jgi:hypothetical protein